MCCKGELLMSLGFVLGTAAMDHQQAMVERLAEDMEKFPNDQFYYLVPNHIKFESELDVLSRLGKLQGDEADMYAQSKLQVLSFSRLAWFFLRNTAGYQVPRISTNGLNMLVFQIMKKHQGELKLYAGEADQAGFVGEVTRQLEELKQANISADDLAQLANQVTQTNQTLNAKLHDLVIIYREYELAMVGQYLGNSEMYQQLADFLESNDFSHAHFYLDRFSQFTASELNIATALIKQAKTVVMALELDKPAIQDVPDVNDMFVESGKLYHRLYNVAETFRVHHEFDTYAKVSRVTSDLKQVEDLLIADAKMAQIAPTKLADQSSVTVFTADSRLTELRQVARQIRQLVATGKYRYRDFLILTKHMDVYSSALLPTFKQFDIPVFDDHEKLMNDHPLVALLNALFNVKSHYYRHADVMQLLKTELLIPQVDGKSMSATDFRDALAITENWLLKTGFHGETWVRKDDWQYFQFRDNDMGVQSDKVETATRQINLIRHYIKEILPPFFKKLDAAVTGTQAATVLYQFLIDVGVDEQLKAWYQEQNEAGNLEVADQAQQVWQTFCGTLDEFVAILGDQPFDVDDFNNLMQAGFDSATYSQIPSTLDQVVISEIGIVQSQKKRVVFVVGANDQVMPEASSTQLLLSDQDKETFEGLLDDTQFLPAGNIDQLVNESFVNYLALMNGNERLIISCATMDDDGHEYKMSPYTISVMNHFGLQSANYQTSPQITDHKAAQYVGTPSSTLSVLVRVQRLAIDLKTVKNDAWRFIDNYLKHNSAFQNHYHRSMGGLIYHNQPVALKPDIVNGLYGDTIRTSVSKLEEFYQNEYAYFLKFGLKLQERDEFELTAANSGELFHSVLDGFIKELVKREQTIRTVSMDEINEMIPRITQEIIQQPQFMILNSSHRMNYIGRQLQATVLQIAQTLKQQSLKSRMDPLRSEVMFGDINGQTGIPGLNFDLDNGKQVRVRGKIDRIDTMIADKQNFAGIVDYKSGDKDVKFSEVYAGLAMQMMTYLNVLQKDTSQLGIDGSVLSSALYLHIQNPTFKLADMKTNLETARLKANMYKGILIKDPSLLDSIDLSLNGDEAGKSLVFPLSFNKSEDKNGSRLGSNSSLITREQLQLLLDRNEERIINAANKIFAGSVELNPARYSQKKTALQYSPYKDIFQFDAMLPDNNYHDIELPANKDFFKSLKEDGK